MAAHFAHHVQRLHRSCHLHHFARAFKLLQQAVDLLQRRSATLRNTLAAAAVDDFRIAAFERSHRLDDSLNALEGIVVDVHILNSLAHTRNHRSQVLQVTHLLDLGNLRHEIVEVKLVFRNFLLQAARLFLVILLLCALNK